MVRKRRFGKIRRYSPRRQYRRFRKGKAPIPILPLLGGVVAPMSASFNGAGGMEALKNDPMKFGPGFVDQVMQHYTGISLFPEVSGVRYWNTAYLFNTYAGLFSGIAGHMIAQKLGVNRQIRKIPLVGKYVSL